jgi:hypothetical protein
VAEQELLVRIVGDDRSLQQAFARSARSTEKFETRTQTVGRSLGRAFAAAGITLGITAAAAAAGRMIKAASDLNEEISKSEQVFGASSRAIQVWSEQTATSIGVAQTQALQATGTFGNLFRTVGLAPEAAGEMSQALVELGADLASFNNANIDDVLNAIRSGLIGEAEPLRRYGVLLSETRVQQAAMAATGKETTAALTDQEKALARYNIILQDTVPAQGDFARTSTGLANQTKILKAQMSDLSAELGSNLLPVMIKLTQIANGLFGAFDRLGTGLSIEVDASVTLAELEAVRAKVASVVGETDLLVIALDKAIGLSRQAQPLTPEDRGGLAGPERVAQSNAKVDERARQAAVAKAKRELELSQKRFAEFTKGLGLKLKKAGQTAQVADDIRVLEEIERAIEAQIAREGRTFELENQLTDVHIAIAQKREEGTAAAEAAEKSADDAEDAADERRKRRREARRTKIQAAQFEALGLTAEGEQRTPGVGALRRRARSLLEQISGTDLDTSKNRDRLGAVLSAQFKDAGREVRDAILAMFNEISGALDGGAKSLEDAMQTSFRVVNTSDILSGLGLSEEETQKLRRRLSRLGPGGTTPRDAGAGGAFGVDTRGSGNVFVTGPVTVVANDPDEFGNKIARDRRRTTVGRTGPHAGTRIGGI